jgi:hypothetical protein
MTDISRSQFDAMDGAYDRAPNRVWRFIRRYELVELVVIIGGIVAAWAGVIFGASLL